MSRPTLPPDRPCWAVRAVRVAQAALAVVGLAVLAWTAAARPVPDPDPPRTRSVVVVTDTTGRLPAYTPVPAGPPCPPPSRRGEPLMLARCLPRQPHRRGPAASGSTSGFVQAAVAEWARTATRPAWLSDDLLRILERRNGRLVGLVYQVHFDQPIGDTTNPRSFASHYTGWTLNLPIRLGEHAAGRGARLMQVVAEQGIGWQVTRLWVGSRGRERSLKRQGGAARRCPVCRLAAAGAAVPTTDQIVLDALELGTPPGGPAHQLARPRPAPAHPARRRARTRRRLTQPRNP